MKNFRLIVSIIIFTFFFGCYNCTFVQSANVDPVKTINRINNATAVNTANPQQSKQNSSKTYILVSPLKIVAQPAFYVGKNVKFQAKFDKFSTLGLDYKPAYRSSEKYITILILRPDIVNHDIPLSELKIFIDRETAEKHIDLNAGDEVEISGTVFSKALGDAWMNVDVFRVIKTTPKTDNK